MRYIYTVISAIKTADYLYTLKCPYTQSIILRYLLYTPTMLDLHTHTTFSDGELIPAELLRRAQHLGYKAIALTDHADPTNLHHILHNLRQIKTLQQHYHLTVLVGVELTHLPPAAIPQVAEHARHLGAEIIIVHGETPVEPVAEGTNHAALHSDIDILAHPGFITPEDAKLAATNNICLELTSRCGHNRTNGHVARMATEHGATLIVNTDAHAPGDLITHKDALRTARGAGLTQEEASRCLENSEKLVARLLRLSIKAEC